MTDMTPTPPAGQRERLAEALGEHTWREYAPLCSCGWDWDVKAWCKTVDTSDITWTSRIQPSRNAAHAAHLADVALAHFAAEMEGLLEPVTRLAEARPDGDSVVRVTIRPIPGIGIGERTSGYVAQDALRAALAAVVSGATQ